MRLLLFACALLMLTVPSVGQSTAQGQGKFQPSLEFGSASVSLGMTVEQVKSTLAQSARQLKFLSDGHTAVVSLIDSKEPYAGEGQVTFYGGRAVYASFQFPSTRSAIELAQEIAGAVESADTKKCSLGNFTAHGTGGGHSDTVAYCGAKTISIVTVESIGDPDRVSFVEINVGAIPTSQN